MSKVCEYINMIEGAKERVIVRNQEQLFIAERAPQPGVSRATLVDDKRTSKFWSFPASADRGLPSSCCCRCRRCRCCSCSACVCSSVHRQRATTSTMSTNPAKMPNSVHARGTDARR